MSKKKRKKTAVQSFSVAGRQAPGDHYTEMLLSYETKVLRKETPYHTITIRVDTPLFIVQPSWTATVCMVVAAVGKTQAKLVRTVVLVKHTYWKGRANVQPTHIKTAKRNSLYHFHNLPLTFEMGQGQENDRNTWSSREAVILRNFKDFAQTTLRNTSALRLHCDGKRGNQSTSTAVTWSITFLIYPHTYVTIMQWRNKCFPKIVLLSVFHIARGWNESVKFNKSYHLANFESSHETDPWLSKSQRYRFWQARHGPLYKALTLPHGSPRPHGIPSSETNGR